jgi:hypothetical protein
MHTQVDEMVRLQMEMQDLRRQVMDCRRELDRLAASVKGAKATSAG